MWPSGAPTKLTVGPASTPIRSYRTRKELLSRNADRTQVEASRASPSAGKCPQFRASHPASLRLAQSIRSPVTHVMGSKGGLITTEARKSTPISTMQGVRISTLAIEARGEASPPEKGLRAIVYVGVLDAKSRLHSLSVVAYGPTPPLWQSLQFTAVISPRSTGCLKSRPGNEEMFTAFSCCSRMVWQMLQSLRITLPSGLT